MLQFTNSRYKSNTSSSIRFPFNYYQRWVVKHIYHASLICLLDKVDLSGSCGRRGLLAAPLLEAPGLGRAATHPPSLFHIAGLVKQAAPLAKAKTDPAGLMGLNAGLLVILFQVCHNLLCVPPRVVNASQLLRLRGGSNALMIGDMYSISKTKTWIRILPTDRQKKLAHIFCTFSLKYFKNLSFS